MSADYSEPYYEGLFRKEIENSQRNQLRLEELLSRKKRGNLLEIGCGLGGFVKLARKHFNVKCLDISTYAVNTLRDVPGIQVIKANAETVNLPPNTYDVIVAFNILEHLKFPENVVQRIQTSLTRGGIFLGSVPNNFGLVGRIATLNNNLRDRTHCSTYPLPRWETIFRTTFERVDFHGEILLSPNHGLYIHGWNWKYISFNAVFTCEKS